MGEIRKRGKIYWVRYYRDGHRHEESSRSTRKGDAVDLLKLREADVVKGLPVSSKVGKLRFDEAAADILVDYEINDRRSRDSAERRIRLHLKPYFGHRRMSSITTADVRAYTASRQQDGASPATINRELAMLKRAYRLAEQAGTLLHHPHIPMLAEDNIRKGFFEREEFEDVRQALPKDLRGLVSFLYCTGWRIGEVRPLRWAQIDRSEQVVRLEVGTTKNREGRTLPYGLLPELVDVIEAQWQEHQRLASSGVLCPWVFHRNGKPIKSLVKAWHTACEKAGTPGKLVHDFRRSAVRNLVRAGVPDTVAMKITGHKTRSVFDRYDITSESDLREGLGKLASVAGTKKGQSARSGRVRRFPESP